MDKLIAVIKDDVVATVILAPVDENDVPLNGYPGSDELVVVQSGQVAAIGGTYKDGVFTPPPHQNVFGITEE